MATAPPGYHDRVFDFVTVCHLLTINGATLNTWLGFIKMVRPFGDKHGHRRRFSEAEIYPLAILVSLHAAGIPVNQSAIAKVLDTTLSASGPIVPDAGSAFTFHDDRAVGVVIYVDRIWAFVHEKLAELESAND